jgi:hypothetical protein
MAQKLERETVGNFCFKIKSIAILVLTNCSYSSIEKSSVCNEPMKRFLSQLLSLLFSGKYSSNDFLVP